MAFEPGGYSDKLGNQYEEFWVAEKLVDLIAERICSVSYEAIGDDEQGVDLWLTHKDGKREAQQCKARNASKEKWSVADLSLRGVLEHMRDQLDRNIDHHFSFVSGVPFTVLGDICESARKSNGNPENFYEFQIKKIGQERFSIFKQFCDKLGVDHAKEKDRAKAYDYLTRMEIILEPFDSNAKDKLLERAAVFVSGDSESTISLLIQFAKNNLRKTITSETVRQYLAGQGLYFRRLSNDNRITPAIEELQVRFEDSIRPFLVAGNLIERSETQELYSALQSDESRLLVLHGKAGQGKSGVVYELTRLLLEAGVAYLPIRLDRNRPENNTKLFGKALGLPESPVYCLDALAGDNYSVLVLDQLDALRWTSLHSANSLDVCKELLRQAKAFSRERLYPIHVVLVTRTFDLDHDPDIKSLLSSEDHNTKKIEVGMLSEDSVTNVISKAGQNHDFLTEKQIKILGSPLMLGMWVKIAKNDSVPIFQTITGLIRSFWEDRYREINKLGISDQDTDSVIDTLAGYMERNGFNSAPKSLFQHRPKIFDALQSLGVVHITESNISFCHQSYMDFRIAQKLIQEIHKELGTVYSWLGSRDTQTLFRREQLRLILTFLSDESPKDFLKAVKEILKSRDVRFHLKHLTLAVLSDIENATASFKLYLIELLNHSKWRDHVFETVFLGRANHVQWLIDDGNINCWLDAGDNYFREKALVLLRSVSDKLKDEVAYLLDLCLESGIVDDSEILHCLCWSIQDDSARMFELRLKIAKKGVYNEYIDWDKLAEKYPLRFLEIARTIFSNLLPADVLSGDSFLKSKNNIHWYDDELKCFSSFAAKHPEITWQYFIPELERLFGCDHESEDWIVQEYFVKENYCIEGLKGFVCGVISAVIDAGRILVSDNNELVVFWINTWKNSPLLFFKIIVCDLYAFIHFEHADQALLWIIENKSQFRLGINDEEPWMPAVRLIKKQSQYCTESVFNRLEYLIIHYHESFERQLAIQPLKGWKTGFFYPFWGQAQYFLLPALDEKRRSGRANDLIQVLNRKFENFPEWRFRGSRSYCGFVKSSIPSNVKVLLSDNSWLEIVRNEKIYNRGNDWRHTFCEEGESSIYTFSTDLGWMANRFPERFGRLALRFPENAPVQYVIAIFRAISVKSIPKEVPPEDSSTWQMASNDTVVAITDKFHTSDNFEFAHSLCWLIQKRPDASYSNVVFEKLKDYAVNHSDPEPCKLNVQCDKTSEEASVHTLESNSLNCVRGVAAHAIASLIWADKTYIGLFHNTIESLVADSHPAVRMSVIEICLATAHSNEKLAVDWFIKACNDDIRIAASNRAVYLFNRFIPDYHEMLLFMLKSMASSSLDDVSIRGAEEVTARWLFYGLFEVEMRQCHKGTLSQRRGVAKIAAQFLLESKYSANCQELLSSFFEEEDEEIVQIINNAFFDKKIFSISNIHNFINKYIQSKAFQSNPHSLLHAIKGYSGSLLPYSDLLFSICEVFSDSLSDISRNISKRIAGDAKMIPPLLLRLYEQAKSHDDYQLLNRCMDSWDLLFEHRVGNARELTQQIDI